MHALESALNQTYDNLEVIVADDASTDDTCAIVRKIEDPRVKLIERTDNEGGAAARNTGNTRSDRTVYRIFRFG